MYYTVESMKILWFNKWNYFEFLYLLHQKILSLRNIALVFCAKLRNLHCELWKAKSAKLRNKKVVFAQYCAWFHCAKLRNLHCELSCATCAIAQKKKLCAKFSATNRKKKCHCVETLSPSSLDNFSFGLSFFKREHSGLIKLLLILFPNFFFFFLFLVFS